MIVDRDVSAVVVTHHTAWVRVGPAAARECGDEARDEAVHPAVADLQVDRPAGVVGIVRYRGVVEMMDRIFSPAVLVGELRSQAIHVPAARLEREVSKHVIERPVLEHQHDYVIDLPEVGDTALLSEPGRGDVVLNASHLDESTTARVRPLLTGRAHRTSAYPAAESTLPIYR